MAHWAKYSTPNEEFVQAFTKAPSVASSWTKEAKEGEGALLRQQQLTAQMMRKTVEEAGQPVGITIDEKRVSVSTPPGEILVRIYTPESQDPSETFPLYFHIHGGAYYLGSIDMDDLSCRDICAKHRIVVVNVEYRLAPQFPFPTGVEDSYEALKWVASNTSDVRADLKKGCIVGGESAGGNFACVITQRALKDPDLQGRITGQILQIPNTISHSAENLERFKGKIISYEQNNDPVLTHESMDLVLHTYKPGDQSDTRVSPLLADSFVGLPPAYVQIAGMDLLRDEGLLYAQYLEEAGVATKVDVYPGVPHGFARIYPQLEISVKWRTDLDAGIRWLLEIAKDHSAEKAV